MPLKFELLQADEHSRYLLRGKTDILYNLRSLVQKRAMISAFIDASADSFLTAILDVNPDNDTLILDAASSDVINDRVDGTEQLICVTQLDKIKIQFAATRPVRINHEGHTAFRIALPEVLLRLQRREYYRLIASNPHSLSCLIPVSSGGEKRMVSMEATVLDISSGGLAILLPPNEPTLEPETILTDCRLMLPETGPIVTSLRVRNIFRITNRDGSTMLRAGCEFTDLPASMASTIQRYILKAERERNARERIR
ncbi:flagellar brake protein YcgR [Zoogloea oryzae]|uniref:Flagellar brake protein YcgR n=1 Tax=Zoogloea oryzae TaxID=310767 RepID=A0ABQ6FAN4_9RHOO|nr:flagellar brake protein [Zoogloea oryzae]GLT22608.1 flagellar brake protein YcgR [Zoogloea oryzae]